jgi:hypothetical protein
MIKAGQQRRFEMESTQEEKLNSVDVSLFPLTGQKVCREDTRRSHAWTKGYLCAWSKGRWKGKLIRMRSAQEIWDLADVIVGHRSR